VHGLSSSCRPSVIERISRSYDFDEEKLLIQSLLPPPPFYNLIRPPTLFAPFSDPSDSGSEHDLREKKAPSFSPFCFMNLFCCDRRPHPPPTMQTSSPFFLVYATFIWDLPWPTIFLTRLETRARIQENRQLKA